jgi:hypothetical protein
MSIVSGRPGGQRPGPAAGKIRGGSTVPVTADKVVARVAAGRSRRKVENENNNTRKTLACWFEHNYAHGKNHLAASALCVLGSVV